MNGQSITEIQKHNNKINRILNKISQKNAGLLQQIDLALYSCLKIQKIIKKYQQQANIKSNTQRIFSNSNGDSNICINEEDQLYQNAFNIMQGFKSATKKLQNKVSILLRQQEINRKIQRVKYHNQIDPYYEVPRHQISSKNRTVKDKRKYTSIYENTSPFSPHIVSSSQSKSKGNHYISSETKNKSAKYKQQKQIRQNINESQSFEEMGDQDESKNIQELDQQIIELASEIKHIIKGR